MICPKCEEGSVEQVKIRMTGEVFSICDFCHSIWTEKESIKFNTGYLLDFFIKRRDHEFSTANSQIIN